MEVYAVPHDPDQLRVHLPRSPAAPQNRARATTRAVWGGCLCCLQRTPPPGSTQGAPLCVLWPAHLIAVAREVFAEAIELGEEHMLPLGQNSPQRRLHTRLLRRAGRWSVAPCTSQTRLRRAEREP
jgi:hypothetical protein